jgi:hypothetical protein
VVFKTLILKNVTVDWQQRQVLLTQGIGLLTLLQLARQYVCPALMRLPPSLLAARCNFWPSPNLSFSEAR